LSSFNGFFLTYVCRTGLGLVRAIVTAVKSELMDSERQNITKGQVFVLASAAVFICSLIVARLLCTDVKVNKAVKCLLGFPVLAGILHQLYCLRTQPNRWWPLD